MKFALELALQKLEIEVQLGHLTLIIGIDLFQLNGHGIRFDLDVPCLLGGFEMGLQLFDLLI